MSMNASPSVFNTSLGTLRMLMNGKSCFIPLLDCTIATFVVPILQKTGWFSNVTAHIYIYPVGQQEFSCDDNVLLTLDAVEPETWSETADKKVTQLQL